MEIICSCKENIHKGPSTRYCFLGWDVNKFYFNCFSLVSTHKQYLGASKWSISKIVSWEKESWNTTIVFFCVDSKNYTIYKHTTNLMFDPKCDKWNHNDLIYHLCCRLKQFKLRQNFYKLFYFNEQTMLMDKSMALNKTELKPFIVAPNNLGLKVFITLSCQQYNKQTLKKNTKSSIHFKI